MRTAIAKGTIVCQYNLVKYLEISEKSIYANVWNISQIVSIFFLFFLCTNILFMVKENWFYLIDYYFHQSVWQLQSASHTCITLNWINYNIEWINKFMIDPVLLNKNK